MCSKFFGNNMYRLVKSRSYKLLGAYIDVIRNPDIPCSEDDSTSLYLVSKELGPYPCETSEMVKFLIHKGADVLWQHKVTGFSPAVYIIQCNDDELVDLLLTKLNTINAPLDSVDGTPLHHAVRSGNEKNVLKLLESGADPNRSNKAGHTPVHEAVLSTRGRTMLKILVKHDGDINRMAGSLLRPIQMTVYTQDPRDSLLSVLQCKPDLDLADATGLNALWFFITQFDKRTDEIFMLIDSGCDPNTKNLNGWNILHLLASKRSSYASSKIVSVLMESGIDINAQTPIEKNTPLHMAISSANSSMVSQLVFNNADLSLKNAKDQTPLDIAVMKCRLDAMQTILSLAIFKGIPEGELLNENGNFVNRDSLVGVIVQTITDKSREELDLMKTTKLEFPDSVSLYDLLCFNEKKLAKLMKHVQFRSNFSVHNNLLKNLRYYKYQLKETIKTAEKLQQAKDEVLEFLYPNLWNKLSLACVRRTVSAMNKRTLMRLQRYVYNFQIHERS